MGTQEAGPAARTDGEMHSFLAGAAPQPAAVQGTCLEPSWRGSAHAASIRQHIWFRMTICLFACGCRFSGDLPVSNAPSSLAPSLLLLFLSSPFANAATSRASF